MITTVTVCKFKRKKNSEEETGLMINGDRLIVDKYSKPVEAPVWNYRLFMELGHVVFDL